ncbi:MAG: 23S rRNA pseudouridine1911/1915/1917 synthase [Zhongshania aliphaticivorans]|jgi:23S rRNA pseudouridine1911/1915/1917 synthase
MAERVIEFSVPAGIEPERADKIFASEFDDISRTRLQKAFEAGRVTFDGMVIDKRFKVNRPGLLRAVLEEIKAGEGPKPVDIPLEIVYEDASMIVVNKPAGMVVHPGNGTDESTLVHALLHHTQGQLSTVGAPQRPGIVHRLDKETTGLIMVAKTDQAHYRLATAFSERDVYKRYCALVTGVPGKVSGTCKESIGRHPVMRTRMAITNSGKPAHTDWSVEQSFGDRAALVHCVIHTGRTHQIRVHMSGLGHSLLGDTTYGFKPTQLREVEVPRVMLHAAELKVTHPSRDEAMHFQAPLPADFSEVLDQLG